MKKRSRKLISILLTLSMLAVLLIPMAAPAAAATGYTSYTKPAVDDDGMYDLGTVLMEAPSDAIEDGDSVIFSLPSGFEFAPTGGDFGLYEAVDADSYIITVSGATYLKVSAPGTIGGETNAFGDAGGAAAFDVDLIDDNQFKVTANANYDPSQEKAFIKIEMNDVYIDEGFDGDIKLTAEAPSGSGFPEGEVVVGKVSGGSATISVVDDETANDTFDVTFRVKEDRASALEAETDSIKLTLPDGFVWNESNGALADDPIWGTDVTLTITDVDDDEIEIGLAADTAEAACFEFTLTFQVDDEDAAEYGEVKVDVDGASDLTPDELVAGTYGDFGATIKADGDAAEVFAGKSDESVVDIVIEETMEGSLVDGRTVTLTLPANARWFKIDDQTVYDQDLNHDGDIIDAGESAAELTVGENVASDSTVDLEFRGLTGTDNRTAKFLVVGDSENDGEAELTIEDISIDTEANVTGDISVTVGGSSGLDGEVVIAKAVAPVTIEVSEKKQVQIGKSGQLVGDITVTELKAGALKEDQDLKIDLPEGISWTATPKVEVISGDIGIDQVYRANSAELTKDNQLVIEIDNESDEPSAIKITGATLSVDRSVPEGNVAFAVVGGAANETGGSSVLTWPNARVAAVTVGAEVATPAPGEYKANAAFVIGSTTYKIAGVEYTMDVAPYVKDGRTFLPVRYVAQTLGVADANILWDAATQKVTLLRDGTVVQLTIGSNVMLLNGAAITMDVAPELTSDRTMLPIRFIAQAFGATVGWDEATQTVTLN